MLKEALWWCALAALCWFPGCGDPAGGGGDPTPAPTPCGGACPVSECVFGVCVGGQDMGQPDQGADLAPDAAPDQGPDLAPDLPDEDLGEDLTPDAPPEDMGDELPPDLPPEDLGEDVADVPLEGCAADEDCPARQYCDLSQGEPRGQCADGCRDDAGCGRGRICQERACVRGCREDEVCPGRSYCDQEALTCQEGCRADNCPEGAACDLEARVCVQGACAVSADCAEGFYCDLALAQPLCVQGCDDDARCGELRCERSLNRCVCDQDAQCAPGEVCQSGSCQPPCASDEDCEPGAFCDPFVRVCAEGCLDDDFEPNDAPLLARALPGAGAVEGRVCLDPVSPQAASDCYALPQEDAAWALRLEADPDSPLALVAYQEEGVEGERAALSQGVASLTLQTAFDRGAVFCVEPTRVVELARSYLLTVERRCLGDAQDAAGDEVCAATLGGAAPLTQGAPLSAEGRLCPEDVDHVSFSMQAGEVASVLFSSGAFGDDAPVVEVLGAGCGEPLLTLEADFSPLRLGSFEAPAAGIYALRVASRADQESGWSASVTLQPPMCREDRLQGQVLEPNDAADQASPLPTRRGAVFSLGEARLCEGDQDWYAVDVVGGDLLRAALTVDAQDAPLQVEVYNTTGRIRLATSGAEGLERVAQTANLGQSGRYLVRVSATAPVPAEGLRYALSLLTAGQVRCAPDGFEGNDSAQEAALLGSGAHRGVICGGDMDWFRLPLAAGERVTMSWIYDHDLIAPLEQLVGTLYGPGGPDDLRDFFLTDGASDADRLSGSPTGFQVAPQDAGPWLLALAPGDQDEALDYTLLISVESPACGADDEPTRNEGCGAATPLPLDTQGGGEVCAAIGDEDWFQVQVQEGQSLEVVLEHFHFDGNLELELYAPGGEVLEDFSYNAGPNEEFVVANDAQAGAWCVRVFARSPQVQNTYTLRATAR